MVQHGITLGHGSLSPGTVTYRARRRLSAGRGLPVLVNTSIGIAHAGSLLRERAKIRAIRRHLLPPDLMMDLSIVHSSPEPWEVLVDEFDGAVGVVPHYMLHDRDRGVDPKRLLDRVCALFASGVAFVTIHATPSRELWRMAQRTRRVPLTSRGGAVILNDLLINNREHNAYIGIIDDLALAAAAAQVVVNLGTTFRAATVADGLDSVARLEIDANRALAARIRVAGAQVVLEGPGHLRLSEIDEYVSCTRDIEAPHMPLGPIVTDAYPGMDHITSAIGAAYMMRRTQGGIINSVTAIEHQGGVPGTTQILQALDAAHLAAHTATIDYHDASRGADESISRARAGDQTCVVPWDFATQMPRHSENAPGCSRCGELCPLTLAGPRRVESYE